MRAAAARSIGATDVAPERRSPEYLGKFVRKRDREVGRPDQGERRERGLMRSLARARKITMARTKVAAACIGALLSLSALSGHGERTGFSDPSADPGGPVRGRRRRRCQRPHPGAAHGRIARPDHHHREYRRRRRHGGRRSASPRRRPTATRSRSAMSAPMPTTRRSTRSRSTTR